MEVCYWEEERKCLMDWWGKNEKNGIIYKCVDRDITIEEEEVNTNILTLCCHQVFGYHTGQGNLKNHITYQLK